MSYFDDPLHSTGALTTALSTHASAVQGVGTIIQGKFYGGFKKGNYFTKLPQMRTNFSRGRGRGRRLFEEAYYSRKYGKL